MKHLDYIALLGIEFLAERLRNRSSMQTMFKPQDLETYAARRLNRADVLSTKDLRRIVDFLETRFAFETIKTPHAWPRFIVNRANFIAYYEDLQNVDPDIALSKKYLKDIGADWLLESILASASELDFVEGAEFDGEDELDFEWEPLPIERPDEQAEAVSKAFDELATVVAADNGYAANVPAEREEVVRRLKEASDWLRKAEHLTASAVQVYVIWPLEQLAARFTPQTTIGALAKFTAGVAAAWLKSRGIKLLDGIFQ